MDGDDTHAHNADRRQPTREVPRTQRSAADAAAAAARWEARRLQLAAARENVAARPMRHGAGGEPWRAVGAPVQPGALGGARGLAPNGPPDDVAIKLLVKQLIPLSSPVSEEAYDKNLWCCFVGGEWYGEYTMEQVIEQGAKIPAVSDGTQCEC